MRIKRWVCALLCLALLLGVLPEVRAAEVSGNFEYKLEQSGTVTITGYQDKRVKELDIPKTIEGHPVTAIADQALRDCYMLSTVNLPEGLLRIGREVFSTDRMEQLVLPSSLQEMEDVLRDCPNLEHLYVYSHTLRFGGNLVTSARVYIHQELVPQELSSYIREIYYCPFEEIGFDPRTQTVYTEGCMRYALVDGEACLLEAQPEGDFTVPDTLGGCPVTRIAPCCFLHTPKLRRLTLPDSVRAIGRYALYQTMWTNGPEYRISMSSLPASLEYVGVAAMEWADLHEITALPDGLREIGKQSFELCDMQTLTVPGSLKVIPQGAFANNPFREVVLCEGVEELNSHCFTLEECKVTVPRSVQVLNGYWEGKGHRTTDDLKVYCDPNGPVAEYMINHGSTFYDIDTGEHYQRPHMTTLDGVSYRVYPGLYAAVQDLELGYPVDLVIPETVEGVPVKKVLDWALCSDALRSVVLPDTVTYIVEDAMIDCPNLEWVRLSERLESLDSKCFAHCDKLQILRVPASVKEIRGDDLGYNRILVGEAGSYVERYALQHGQYFVAEEPGEQYAFNGPALCRLEPDGAVLVGLALTFGNRLGYSWHYYEIPDAVLGLPIVGIDGDVVFSRHAEDLFLGRYVSRIGQGALDGTEIWRLYTFPALEELPEDLFERVTLYNDRIPEIQGFFGSYAQEYASEHGYSFVEIDGTPFADVPRDSWFFEPVFQCYWSGLMNGTSATAFSPHSVASRAMLVTVLWRLMGARSPQGTYFADVAPESWYYESVNWAAENGVVYGTGPYRFSPNQSVTREQTAAILFRLASAMGLPADGFAPLGGFRDADQASDYARSALMWAVDAGIMQGNNRGELRPRGTATRAELAAMLIRFVTWCEKEMVP